MTEPTPPEPSVPEPGRADLAEPGGPRLLVIATVGSTIRMFLTPLAKRARARGWHVEAAASRVADAALDPEAFQVVHELPLSRSLRSVRSLPAGVLAIRRLVGATRPDVVHVHTPIASFVTRLAVRTLSAGTRPAVVYTAHGFHFHQRGRRLTNAVFLFAERLAGRWTDRLIVINDEDEAAALRHRIVSRSRLVHMPGIGIDTAWYARDALPPGAPAAARAELDVPSGAPLFVTVGELNANKRQSDAIRALARMTHRDARLALLGNGPSRPALEAMTTALGVEDRVRFAGTVMDVRPAVAASTALLITSLREGLARSVMEALALEVPVIASTARGNRELVGDDGIVVEVGDVPALSAAMDWLIDHRDEAAAMGRRARARMVRRYELGVVGDLHERLYDELLAERAARVSRSAPR